MRENDHRGILPDLCQVLLQPGALRIPNCKWSAAGIVQLSHGKHSCHWCQTWACPVILDYDRIKHHEVHPFMLKGIGRLPEELPPFLAHVEIPVVLPDHHPQRRLEF